MKNKPFSTHVQEITPQALRNNPAPESDPSLALPSADRGGFVSAWTRFWFTACDPLALHGLRILAGLLFLSWLLPLAGHAEEFFSLNGWVDVKGYKEMSRLPPEQRPPLGWSLLYLEIGGRFLFEDKAAVEALYWITILVFVLFTLGLATRVTGVATWILMVSFISFLAGPASHGEDDLLVLLAFYLMIGYLLLGQFSRNLSTAERILGSWDTFVLAPLFRKNGSSAEAALQPSYAANLAMRLYQVHFALFLVTSGLHKLQFGDWWSGVAWWYPRHQPFATSPSSIRAEAPHAMTLLLVFSLTQYLALAWQLTFPLWAWRERPVWRVLLVGGGLLTLVGSFLIYNIPALGPTCLVGCLSYITSEEWRRFGSMLTGIVQKSPAEAAARAHERKVPLTV